MLVQIMKLLNVIRISKFTTFLNAWTLQGMYLPLSYHDKINPYTFQEIGMYFTSLISYVGPLTSQAFTFIFQNNKNVQENHFFFFFASLKVQLWTVFEIGGIHGSAIRKYCFISGFSNTNIVANIFNVTMEWRKELKIQEDTLNWSVLGNCAMK